MVNCRSWMIHTIRAIIFKIYFELLIRIIQRWGYCLNTTKQKTFVFIFNFEVGCIIFHSKQRHAIGDSMINFETEEEEWSVHLSLRNIMAVNVSTADIKQFMVCRRMSNKKRPVISLFRHRFIYKDGIFSTWCSNNKHCDFHHRATIILGTLWHKIKV